MTSTHRGSLLPQPAYCSVTVPVQWSETNAQQVLYLHAVFVLTLMSTVDTAQGLMAASWQEKFVAKVVVR